SERRELSQDAGVAISRAAADHFLDVTKALLDDKPIPFAISINGEQFLVTASHAITKGLPRYLPLDKHGHPPPSSVYGTDYQLRKFSSPRYGTGRPHAEVRRLRNEYSVAMNEKIRAAAANSNPFSDVRRRLIAEALLSFCIYTYFDTGANVTTLQGKIRDGVQQNAVLVSDIVSNDGTLVLSAERGVKGYLLSREKPRAGNKVIPILFSSIWVKRMLPMYLKLRDHLSDLGVSVPENLIFSLLDPTRNDYAIERNPRISQRLKANCGHILNHVLQKYDMERISIQQIRNYKTVSISRTHGPAASARIHGHSLETALKHYNRVEEAEAQLQISNCLNKIMSIAIVSAGAPENRRLAGGGACTKPDSLPDVAVESEELGLHSPNCRTRTGCWMCPHFAVHADKEDIWKMKSYLFVIEELRASSLDPAGVAAVHKPIVNRLIDLCDRIVSESSQLADAASGIDRMIANGQLHPVYHSLLDTYEKVNLI
ncbi:hypothetical protein, partial [Eudoraea sp.]|uniref:hypothetical protein n=1 Tax=Eudoraea sp. TaxID=1979955 RepID=UPI003C747BFC